jgi:uncharacterized protein YrrD
MKGSMTNAPVMSIQTGRSLGAVSDAIIDPRKLEIVAWYIKGSTLDHQPAVVMSQDFRELGSLGAIVDSADKIISPSDVVRLQKILDHGFKFEGIKVFDDDGNKLGRVETYAFDPEGFDIEQIYIRPKLLSRLSLSYLIVGRKQIVELNNQKMIVKSPKTAAPVVEKAPEAAEPPAKFENPFRGEAPKPVPETKRV